MTEIFNQPDKLDLRRKLRNNPTKSESILWKHLKGSQLGFKFKRQCGIGDYIVDFYCPKIKLVVEVDGITHFDEKVFLNDQKRQRYLENLGLMVKRYSTDSIFFEIDQVLFDLHHTCTELDANQTTP